MKKIVQLVAATAFFGLVSSGVMAQDGAVGVTESRVTATGSCGAKMFRNSRGKCVALVCTKNQHFNRSKTKCIGGGRMHRGSGSGIPSPKPRKRIKRGSH